MNQYINPHPLLLPAWTNRQPLVDTIHCCSAMTLLRALPDGSVNCFVSSPPYWGLRSYLPDGHPNKPHEIGLELTLQDYIAALVILFREGRRVLRDDGVLWLNMGDSYAGSWGNYAPNGIKNRQRMQTEGGERWERNGYQDTNHRPPNASGSGLAPKNLVGVP